MKGLKTLKKWALSVEVEAATGGYKDSSIDAWQKDEVLKYHAEEMIKISSLITERIKNKDIRICDDGTLEGDLYFEEETNNQ